MDSQSTATAPPPLVITGMHRSGTSLLASILATAGVNVGDELLGATECNRRGHFEDIDFYRFHQRVLAANGLAREGLTCRTPIDVPASARPEAIEIVSRRREPSRVWGWKDPRTTLFLDFWADLLPDARFLFVFRPPWEVVDSLYRRGDDSIVLNPRLAVDVWCAYNRRILDFASAHPDRCLVTTTARVAADPVGIVIRAAALLGRPLVTPAALFEPSLMVTAHPPEHRVLVEGIRPDAVPLHDDLCRLAGVAPPPAAADGGEPALAEAGIGEWVRAAAADRARGATERVTDEQSARLTALTAQLDTERAAAQHHAGQLATELETERAAAADLRSRHAAELDAERAEARDLAERVAAEARDRAAIVSAWEEERRERDRLSEVIAPDRARHEEALASRGRELLALAADREEERRHHHDSITALSRDVEALTAGREADRVRHRATIEALENDLTSLAARLAAERSDRDEAAARKHREFEARLAASEARRRDLEERLAAVMGELSNVSEAREADRLDHDTAIEALQSHLAAATRAAEEHAGDLEQAATALRVERDAQREACRAARDELSLANAALARAERARQAAEVVAREAPSRGGCPEREAALAAQLQAERELFETLRQDMVAHLDAALDAAA